METIIITTDFSESATLAAIYGLKFGQALGANKFILYHSFELPTVMLDVPISEIEHEQEYESSLTELENLRSVLSTHAQPQTTIDIITNVNPLLIGTEKLAKAKNASLVIAGSTGKSDFARFFLGSNTKVLAQSCSLPLLIVPPESNFDNIDNIVFACDIKHASETTPTDVFKHLTSKLHSKVLVVNVELESKPYGSDIIEEQKKLHRLLEDIPTEFHFIRNNNLVEGILQFADEKDAKLIVAVPRSYSFLETIFHKSVTKKLTDTSEVPLLIMRPTKDSHLSPH